MSYRIRLIVLALNIALSSAAALCAEPVKAPAAALPVPPGWQAIDITKLTKEQCDQLKLHPLICPDGDPSAACRLVKQYSELKCPEVLDAALDILPKGFRESFVNYTALIILALLSLLASNVIGWVNGYKSRAEAKRLKASVDRSQERVEILEGRVLDPFFERPLDFDQYATNMILIGEGGSGKTALVHALSSAGEAQPDVATDEVSSYTLVHEITIGQKGKSKRRLVRIYTDDYVGQDWVQGTQSPMVRARQRYVRSSTLVIIVDLVAPGTRLKPALRRDRIQTTRVKEQLRIYNEPALQNLSSLLGDGGQIILFINKIDLIYPTTDETISEAKQSYAPLIQALSEMRGVKLKVLVGSATTGLGLVGFDQGNSDQTSLLKLVTDHAEKIDLKLIKAREEVVA